MNIFKSKKDIIGFDDRWLVLIGIPIVALIVDVMLYGSNLINPDLEMLKLCYPVGLYFTAMLWLSFREMLCILIRKFPSDMDVRKRQLISIFAIILGFFVLDFILSTFLMILANNSRIHIIEPNFILKTIASLIFSFLIFGIYEGIYLTSRLGKNLLEKEKLIKENVMSQLSGLRSQINPHFLFNSLNTLSTLVHEDAQRADQFVAKLAKVYRYMLDTNEDTLVTLEDELGYLEAYRHLLKERFGDNLIFTEEIHPSILKKYIVPLSLQITFENCVKHNVATKTQPLTISLHTSANHERICIRNNKQKMNFNTPSTGVGLENIKQRYIYFSDKKVIIKDEKDYFQVCLPLLKENILKNP